MTELVHLVFPQSISGDAHPRGTWEQHGRQLKAERVAGPGGHHGQDVPSLPDCLDEILLPGAKGRVAEMPMERREQIDNRRRRTNVAYN